MFPRMNTVAAQYVPIPDFAVAVAFKHIFKYFANRVYKYACILLKVSRYGIISIRMTTLIITVSYTVFLTLIKYQINLRERNIHLK